MRASRVLLLSILFLPFALSAASCITTPISCPSGQTLYYSSTSEQCPNGNFTCGYSAPAAVSTKPIQTTPSATKPATASATQTTSTGIRTLSLGMRGSDVTVLQAQLIARGLLLSESATSYFGSLTRAAVQKFQRENNIVSSGTEATTGYGTVGPRTRAALSGLASGGSSSPYAQQSTSQSQPSTMSSSPSLLSTLLAQLKALQDKIAALNGRTTTQTSVAQTPPPASCSLDNTTLQSGQSTTFYSSPSVQSPATCASMSQSRSCFDGTLSGAASYTHATCAELQPQSGPMASCIFNNQSIASGQSVTAYQSASVAYGNQCVSESRTCTNGTLSGSHANSACSVAAAVSCTLNGVTVVNGASRTFYSDAGVAFGDSCTNYAQNRTCSNGTLSGSNAFNLASCVVGQSNVCAFNNQTVAHGSSVTAYQSSSAPFGSQCVSESRTCSNGALSGNYQNVSCAVAAPVSCAFNGQTIQHGGSVLAYQSSSVSFGNQCVNQTRTCTNGALSGSYTNPTCSVGTAASCTLDGATLASGSSQTFYSSQSVAYGSQCSAIGTTRTCTNGSLSGASSYQYKSCVVQSPASCTFNGQTIASGQSVTAYQASSVPSGSQCVSEQRACTNGSFNGSYTNASCAVAANSSGNPYYDINPTTIFPGASSLLPQGVTYTDTVPDTLDLAERAGWFLQGATESEVPLPGYNIWVPGGNPVFTQETASWLHSSDACAGKIPCIGNSAGYQNWGKEALGMFLAREMTAYDRSDAYQTLSTQFRSMRTMLDWNTYLTLNDYAGKNGLGGQNHVFGGKYITPATLVMIALEEFYQYAPSVPLKTAIDEYVRMHKDYLIPQTISGKTYYDFLDIQSDGQTPTEPVIGYQGRYDWFAYVDARAAIAMFTWYGQTGSQDAFDIGSKLNDFLRNFTPLWTSPDTSRFPPQAGQFVGETHSYLQAALSFLFEAEVRRKNNPQDAIAQDDINRAQAIYEFTKVRTGGQVVGNFGDMDDVDDMIRIGLRLTDLGAADYYDDVDRWTRNQLAEGQIDAFTGQHYIANYSTGNYATDHVGGKVTGVWYSDATHALAIPSLAWMYTIDGAMNPMHALYQVWNHVVQIKGSVALINLSLNRASQYLDVKSDLPYRGRVEVDTKQTLGPVTTLAIRVPNWADKSKVTVSMTDASGAITQLASGTGWSWTSSLYVTIPGVKANTAYVVSFPMVVRQMQFADIRAMDKFWHEADYGTVAAPEQITWYTGTFRGNTLVDATPRPSGGIPRYQRQDLAALPAGDAANVPQTTVTRFIFNGNSTSIPVKPPPTCTMSFSPATVGPNEPSTFSWSSANASAVTTSAWGQLATSGSIPNTKSGQTLTVQGTASGPGGTGTCSATLTVTNAPSSSCGAGWVLVPGDPSLGTSNFCIMEFEAQNPIAASTFPQVGDLGVSAEPRWSVPAAYTSQQPTSQYSTATDVRLPWIFVTQPQAAAACASIGAHLTTAAEAQTINRNVESLNLNWPHGIGHQCMYGGHVDLDPNTFVAAPRGDDQSNDPYQDLNVSTATISNGAGQCPFTLSSNGIYSRRTLYLSNGNMIWDWSGNVGEWLADTCYNNGNPAGSLAVFNEPDGNGPSWWDYRASDHVGAAYTEWTQPYLQDRENPALGPSNPNLAGSSILNSNWGVGKYWGCYRNGNAMYRGGYAGKGSNGGVFNVNMGHTTNFNHNYLGFRCAKAL